MKKTFYLYLAFGLDRFKQETIYSIISLYRVIEHPSDITIVVVTDDINYFSPILTNYPIEFITIGNDELNMWEVEKYVFYSKIYAIDMFFNQYKSDVLYIDADTIFKRDLSGEYNKLDEKFFMHAKCVSLSRSLITYENNWDNTVKPKDFLSRQLLCYKMLLDGFTFNGKHHKVDPEFTPYNGGVIGISYSKRELIPYILELSKYFFLKTGYRSAEELAFSFALQEYGNVISVEDSLLHYYDMKETRLIAGSVLNCLSEQDILLCDQYLSEYGIKDLSNYSLAVDDIISFNDYIKLFKGNQKPYYGNQTSAKMYLQSLDEREAKNRINFRKWAKKELKANLDS